MNPPGYIDYTPRKGEWPTWLCHYKYKGVTYSFNIKAENWEDAKARVRTLSLARVDGQLYSEIYVPLPKSTPTGVLRMIGNILRNYTKRLLNRRGCV